eukprot:PhF_6_TR6222/c3_g1_i1/m.9390
MNTQQYFVQPAPNGLGQPRHVIVIPQAQGAQMQGPGMYLQPNHQVVFQSPQPTALNYHQLHGMHPQVQQTQQPMMQQQQPMFVLVQGTPQQAFAHPSQFLIQQPQQHLQQLQPAVVGMNINQMPPAPTQMAPAPRPPGVRTTMTCHHCGEFGHLIRRCPYRNGSSGNNTPPSQSLAGTPPSNNKGTTPNQSELKTVEGTNQDDVFLSRFVDLMRGVDEAKKTGDFANEEMGVLHGCESLNILGVSPVDAA